MTGLDLESFLHLLRADVGAWATLGVIAAVLGLMAWTSWGSRRALRKCLVVSVAAHCGLAIYGGNAPVLLLALEPEADPRADQRIRNIRVMPAAETSLDDAEGRAPGDPARRGPDGRGGGSLAPWDRSTGGLALADAKLTAPKTETARLGATRRSEPAPMAPDSAAPETNPPAPPSPETRSGPAPAEPEGPPPSATPVASEDVSAPVVAAREAGPAAGLADRRLRPGGDRPRADLRPTAPRSPLAPTTVPDAPAAPRVSTPLPVLTEKPGGLGATTGTTAATTAPAPSNPPTTGASDAGVAAPEVVAARPNSPRLAAGPADLRSPTRPGSTGTRNVGSGTRTTAALPAVAAPPLEAAVGASEAAGPSGVTATPEPRQRPTALAADEPRAPAPAATGSAAPEVAGTGTSVKAPVAPLPRVAMPESDLRRQAREGRATAAATAATAAAASPPRRTATADAPPLALARVTPSGVPALPDVRGASGGRPLADVPEVYRSRLDPNRSARAYRAGASPASEQAVERALDWLARHQDADGRWDGATARYGDGSAVTGDDDYTVHCPAGEVCFGECPYWEADTALTGLALLAYLGAGYTQADGKYAETVGKGLDYLLAAQKPDGDLRGASRTIGMYCHAMATLAVCEAYALTGDERLRRPVERAVNFILSARAQDRLAWRYAPGAPVGDTSILGWVVLALKSAREVGIEVPSSVQTGILGWLGKVADGPSKGLARYQPWEPVTPTMTAEAWVCRQFLGVGGPGPASTEAASHLLAHGPKTEGFNIYYWYYGTLAMYQHGGAAWSRWNAEVRDEIVRRQRTSGHAAGSWDPDDSRYKGGRIYGTALATLSLEVYYRYLRLYDEPDLPPPSLAPARTRTLGRTETDPARPAPSAGGVQYRQSLPRR